jgi:hypothetical protein
MTMQAVAPTADRNLGTICEPDLSTNLVAALSISRARACLDVSKINRSSKNKSVDLGIRLLSDSESTSSPLRRSAPSARRVATEFLCHPWADSNSRWLSLSLTTRSGDFCTAEQYAHRFAEGIERRIPGCGGLVCLDLSATGRWHLHCLVIVPTRWTAQRLIRLWRHLWPRGARPSPKAQLARPLETNDLSHVLQHHIRGPRRIQDLIAPIPSMADRITASGAFREPWLQLLPWVTGHRRHPPRRWPISPPRRLKASTNLTTPISRARDRKTSFPRKVLPGCCLWCSKPLPPDIRRDVRFHPGCRRSACQAVAHRSEKIRSLVAEIELRFRLLRGQLPGSREPAAPIFGHQAISPLSLRPAAGSAFQRDHLRCEPLPSQSVQEIRLLASASA